ncbi:NBS-LRR type resistance protein [Cucumis melo var. makuwa]|uniref:NBS-LRR type resistance protein n=1 Tax=Cucumis melo var. makuwa TaxID=1194695 RepID=A0A5D3C6K2_CUCMM|nr:NBS-LRR type resistance protein [Cucumis melo var. makuwa]
MPFDARRESDSLHIPATEIRGAQLSNAWLGIGNHCPCTKKLATLFDGGKVQHLYEPQKSKVKPTLEEEIMRLQTEGPKLRRLVEVVRCERRSDYAFKKDGALLKNKRGTLRKQSSGSVERTHQSRDLEGCTYQSIDPEGYTYQSSDPEGCTYQSSDPEGCTYQSSDPEGCTYQSSDPEGCTYQSSDPEGYTYP